MTRPGLGDYTVNRSELEKRAGDVLNWVSTGELNLRIGAEFSLEDAPEAHRQLENRSTTGKLLLIP